MEIKFVYNFLLPTVQSDLVIHVHISLVAQMVKSLLWETQVQSLGWEDLLEKEMVTHSSILAWRIPQRSLVGYSSWGWQRVGQVCATSLSISSKIRKK